MPISIAKAQQEALRTGALDDLGEGRDSFAMAEAALKQYADEFLRVLGEYANRRDVVASGKVLSDSRVEMQEDGSGFKIYLNDYFDYPNEGVRGKRSSKNAPNSKYRFKTFGMSNEGRASLRQYIESGKATIRSTENDKARGIGREQRGLDALTTKVNTLAYLIKAYGIKTTNYFNDAVKDVFKDFEVTMADVIGREIVFNIQKAVK